MKNLKKYTTPSTEAVKVGITDLFCVSTNSNSADEKYGMMSKDVPVWVFEEDEED